MIYSYLGIQDWIYSLTINNMNDFIFFDEQWNAQWVKDPLKFPESSELGLQHRENNNK